MEESFALQYVTCSWDSSDDRIIFDNFPPFTYIVEQLFVLPGTAAFLDNRKILAYVLYLSSIEMRDDDYVAKRSKSIFDLNSDESKYLLPRIDMYDMHIHPVQIR
uniref:Uncharacterized protein n=1 Tax=Glossina pallidipes TaxID=7398 RepID=A0A1A9ZFN0_GLOPL